MTDGLSRPLEISEPVRGLVAMVVYAFGAGTGTALGLWLSAAI